MNTQIKNQEAINLGRKGGLSTFLKYGKEHFSKLGLRSGYLRSRKVKKEEELHIKYAN